MKKSIIALTLAAILVLAFSALVFAESETAAPQWFKDMMTWKKEQINQAVSAGKLTEDQAKAYYERLEQMEKYHAQNGFNNMMGNGAGACGSGFGGSTQNGNVKFGPGMMNGGFQMMRGRF